MKKACIVYVGVLNNITLNTVTKVKWLIVPWTLYVIHICLKIINKEKKKQDPDYLRHEYVYRLKIQNCNKKN